MKTKNKALLLTLCAVALAVSSALGTMAYLTDRDAVTNTFTIGNVGLTLDEADVKTDGSYETDHESRVQKNEYRLIPGHTYIKDPTVTVDAGSADAYVRMLVKVEGMDQLKRAIPNDGTTARYYGADENKTFLLQELCVDENGGYTWDGNTWKFHNYAESEDGKTGTYEFRYKEVVSKSANDTVLPDLFTRITVPGEIDNERLGYLKDVKIVVNAHAIQADGFETADAAWEAFDNQNKTGN